MIYTGSPIRDYYNILQHINEFSKAIGVQNVQIDEDALKAVCVLMVRKFPYIKGVENASAFKKVANFVAHFVHYKPIKTEFTGFHIDGLESYDINAVIAFDIAIICLEQTLIRSKLGDKPIGPIYVSDHSYADIIDALSSVDICPDNHFKLISVLFEQITYKTNSECEYKTNPGKSFYPGPYSVQDGDDMAGV